MACSCYPSLCHGLHAPRAPIYRLLVAFYGYRRGRTYAGRGPNHRGAYCAIEPCQLGVMGWTADQTAEPGRLQGSGTFCYAGALRAIAAVRQYFQQPSVYQVQIRTNQDQTVLVYNRQIDGRITFYRSERA